jgi:predicted nucleotidyltransferase
MIKVAINDPVLYDFNSHSSLSSALWGDSSLKDNIRETLLKIVDEFINFLKIDVEIKDIQLTGSLANYNYTKFSDIDLHILFDFSEVDENVELVKDYLHSKKSLWNNKHTIKIKGYEVEIYPQDVDEPHHSTGIYSILNDEWIVKPEPSKLVWARTNLDDIQKKVKELASEIDQLLELDDGLEQAERLKEKIVNMRRSGLEEAGEHSVENLTFKVLRRLGYLKKLADEVRDKYDRKFSLDEKKEWWKRRRGLDNKNYRVLIGKAARKFKHVKKGGPFKVSPPKKLGPSAPPG